MASLFNTEPRQHLKVYLAKRPLFGKKSCLSVLLKVYYDQLEKSMPLYDTLKKVGL